MGLDNVSRRVVNLFEVLKSLGFVVRRSQISHDYNTPPCLSLECYIGQEPETVNREALSVQNGDLGYYEGFNGNHWQAVPSSVWAEPQNSSVNNGNLPIDKGSKLVVENNTLYFETGGKLQPVHIRQLNSRNGEVVMTIKPLHTHEEVNGFRIQSVAANPLEPNFMNYLLYKDEKLLGTFDSLEEAKLVAEAPLFLDNLKAVLGKSRLEPGALDVLDKN